MRVRRKIVANQEEINEVKERNKELFQAYAGQPHVPQAKLPIPIYSTYEWNFRINQLNSFYVEREAIDSQGQLKQSEKGEGDIIAGVIYEGIIRLEYDPLVVSKFELALSGE